MNAFTIGKVARMAEVGVETIRFYERRGLIPELPRPEFGYRQYPQETVHRLRFIKQAKELGFTLNEIKELFDLRLESPSSSTCDQVRTLAEEKIADVRCKIETLQRMEAVLAQLVRSCRSRNVTGNCPILETLSHEEPNEREHTEPSTTV